MNMIIYDAYALGDLSGKNAASHQHCHEKSLCRGFDMVWEKRVRSFSGCPHTSCPPQGLCLSPVQRESTRVQNSRWCWCSVAFSHSPGFIVSPHFSFSFWLICFIKEINIVYVLITIFLILGVCFCRSFSSLVFPT